MKKKRKFDYHHRLPQSRGGTDTFPVNNLVKVSKHRHAYWHALFANRDVESTVEELNNVWLDPRLKLVIVQNE